MGSDEALYSVVKARLIVQCGKGYLPMYARKKPHVVFGVFQVD